VARSSRHSPEAGQRLPACGRWRGKRATTSSAFRNCR